MPFADPPGHCLNGRERLLVTTIEVHVQVPGHDLVIRVKGSPHLLQGPEPAEEIFRKSAQISVLVCLLTLRELRHHGVGLRLDFIVPGAGVGEGACGKVVTGEMPSKFAVRFLPSSKRLSRRLKSGRDAESVKQAIGRKREQPLCVLLYAISTATTEKPDLPQRKGVS